MVPRSKAGLRTGHLVHGLLVTLWGGTVYPGILFGRIQRSNALQTHCDAGFQGYVILKKEGYRNQALSLWSGSTDSKTLDYQRTNPREYQILRTHTKEPTWIQDPASPNHQWHPVQDTSPKQQTKQKYKPNHQQTGLPPHSALTSEEKQTNKNSAQISPYKKLTQTTGPTLGGQKPKGRNNSNLKPGKKEISNTISFF